MNRASLNRWCLFIILVLYGCSVDVSVPQQNIDLTPSPLSPNPKPGNLIPWSNLNLSGKLIYVYAFVQNSRLLFEIRSLDLASGDTSTIFQTPENAWLDAVTVSPDKKQLIMSYTPPANNPAYTNGGQDTLYIMPIDGSQPPQLLFVPQSRKDKFYQPQWSPDGKYVYFTNFSYQSLEIDVMRMSYPNGKLEKLASHAYWPRVSNNGSRLVYVTFDPGTGNSHLVLANLDGSDPQRIPFNGSSLPTFIDSPMFSADDQSIIFSAPLSFRSSLPNWQIALLGAQVMHLADGTIPSDWWSIPITGGTAKPLTHVQSLALYGFFSPDYKYIASFSTDGIFVMNPDGSGITTLVDDVGGIAGTVSWIP